MTETVLTQIVQKSTAYLYKCIKVISLQKVFCYLTHIDIIACSRPSKKLKFYHFITD